MSQKEAQSVSAVMPWRRFFDALIAGDRQACADITDAQLASGIRPLALYQELYQPALYRVGDLWSANQVSVATEHMATAITEGLLNRVYPRLINPQRSGRKAVLATVEDELHQVGVKMAADVFEMHGWDGVFPGAGVGIEELLELIDRERPDVVGLSFSIYFHLDTLDRMLARLQQTYSDLPVLVGGQGLDLGGGEVAAAYDRVSTIRGLDELDVWVAHFSGNRA